jgi:hypothetical protein
MVNFDFLEKVNTNGCIYNLGKKLTEGFRWIFLFLLKIDFVPHEGLFINPKNQNFVILKYKINPLNYFIFLTSNLD